MNKTLVLKVSHGEQATMKVESLQSKYNDLNI